MVLVGVLWGGARVYMLVSTHCWHKHVEAKPIILSVFVIERMLPWQNTTTQGYV